jgi:hypothetical protein
MGVPRVACSGARRALLPMHRDLRLAGQLPPLDAPHHMRAAEWRPFREGVVLRSAAGAGSVLDVGLGLVRVPSLPPCSVPLSAALSPSAWLVHTRIPCRAAPLGECCPATRPCCMNLYRS